MMMIINSKIEKMKGSLVKGRCRKFQTFELKLHSI
jgi:hypothetical protein